MIKIPFHYKCQNYIPLHACLPTCISEHITKIACWEGTQNYNLNDPILYLYFISVKCLNCSLFEDVFGFISNRNLSWYNVVVWAMKCASAKYSKSHSIHITRFENIVKRDPVKRLINENTYL